jgi:hypothetical protein
MVAWALERITGHLPQQAVRGFIRKGVCRISPRPRALCRWREHRRLGGSFDVGCGLYVK